MKRILFECSQKFTKNERDALTNWITEWKQNMNWIVNIIRILSNGISKCIFEYQTKLQETEILDWRLLYLKKLHIFNYSITERSRLLNMCIEHVCSMHMSVQSVIVSTNTYSQYISSLLSDFIPPYIASFFSQPLECP